MAWFKNLKVSVKLLLSFILIACIAGAIGVVGIINIIKINTLDTELYEGNTIPIASMGQWIEGYSSIRVAKRDIIISSDRAFQEKRAARIQELKTELEVFQAEYEARISSDFEREHYKTLVDAYAQYLAITDRIIELALSGQVEEAERVMSEEAAGLANLVNDTGIALLKDNIEQAKNKSMTNDQTAGQSVVLMTTLISIGMVLAISLGFAIARMISRPIQSLVVASQKVADGDMNVTIEVNSKDEIGTLAQAFRAMTDSMNEVLQNITNAADQVASGSRQVSEASQTLSQGSTEQASSIQQLTASMEQIASQTKQNAVSAEQANQLALAASTDAELGNSQMKGMLTAMEDINESSGNISKIIKVIDEIAFQTNILALNAAVEAARAGQHGKGFAVVAEEVRNLAARSANAAKETTVLIEGSIKKVESGTRIANDTAQALDKIVGGINKAATLVGSIANASNEQAIGITQVNQGIAQVSDVIQANSATSEQCAAASEELSGQSEQLKVMVSRFRLKRSPSASYRSLDTEGPQRARMMPALAHAEAAAALAPVSAGKPRIQLDDNDFGKYQ